MNRVFRWVMVSLLGFDCLTAVLLQTVQAGFTLPSAGLSAPASIVTAQTLDFSQHFRALGVEGSILIYDLNRDRTYQHNPLRNSTPFLPASTFKILNSLISLETGVLSDELALLTWDGIQRQIPEWNRDLNMKEAFKRSAVWFYQVLARRVGHERMQKWVAQVGYGNQNIGSQTDIDKFWLEGELRITPQAQVAFLQRLYQEDLPFSKRSIAIVKDIMITEKTPEYTIRAKTGWVGLGNKAMPQIGWYVGYVEKGKDAYFFATNIDIRNPEKDPAARIALTRRCFKDLGLL